MHTIFKSSVAMPTPTYEVTTTPPFAAVIAAECFAVGIRTNETHLTEVVFLPPQSPQQGASVLAQEVTRQISAWLADPTFKFDLALVKTGSLFRQRVWAAISAIPFGETRTYADLAHILNSAPRAIGGACGANPFPIIVPCHRVVAKSASFNAGLGGFAHARDGYLLDTKRWLLQHERHARK